VIFTPAFAMAAMVAFAQPPGNSTGAANPSPPASIQNIDKLQGIVIVPKYADVVDTGVPGVRGVQVKGPEFLKNKGFEKVLEKSLGIPLTESELRLMQSRILDYCKAQGHIVVDVITPEQRILEGTVQIAVIEAGIEKITVEHEGRAWYSDSIVRRGTHLATNGAVQGDLLDSDLSWLNNNTYQSLGWDDFEGSFREVSANFSRSPQETNLWQTDVKLQEKDRFPLRVFTGYDNYGIPLIGENQAYGGLTWANAFGLDQRANYEYLTDASLNKLREHTASYVIPLPGWEQFSLFGTYADVNPNFGLVPGGAGLTQKGSYYQASGRYTISLPGIQKFDHQITLGFDFKRTDTPLLFGNTSLELSNHVDVEQFNLAYIGSLRDGWGDTTFSLQGFYSPGGALETEFAKNSAYDEFRSGTKVAYAYGRAELHRETILPLSLPEMGGVPEHFTWFLRGSGQYADARLLPTEQFGLGGYDTVRGYDERVVNGDDGWLLVNEIRTPHIVLGNMTGSAGGKDWIQGLVFCDYGEAINRQPIAQDEDHYETLLSVGFGLRYQMSDNLRFRLDCGYQLDRNYATTAPNAGSLGSQPRNLVNFGVEVSF
jgi:hemolysin activation/secretion protein